MKRIYSWLLLLTLVLGLCACGQSEETQWQEQYDLGVRYLSEGNYEEAIIAFTAAIEIDPKQPDAYLKASEAHMGMGDTEAAISILEEGFAETNNEEIQSRLDEIMSTNDSVDGEEVLQFPLTYQILDSGGIVPEVEDIYYEVNTIDGKVTFKYIPPSAPAFTSASSPPLSYSYRRLLRVKVPDAAPTPEVSVWVRLSSRSSNWAFPVA